MNAADQAIEEIRAVRHRISAEHRHDIGKYLAGLRAEEKQNPAQLKRGEKLLARRHAERKKYPSLSGKTMSCATALKNELMMGKCSLIGTPGTKEVAQQLARRRQTHS